jgi:maltooligosyltrehalose trehalohydrolase
VGLGRRKEFSEFGWSGEIPNPQDERTFADSRLQQRLRNTDTHRTLRLFYQELIRFRRANHLGADADLEITVSESPAILTVFRNSILRSLLMIFNFDTCEVELPSVGRKGRWATELRSPDSRWFGPIDQVPRTVGPGDTLTLPAQSFVVLSREGTEERHPFSNRRASFQASHLLNG